MESRQNEVIKRHSDELVRKMNVDKVVDHLYKTKFLSEEMKERLDAERSRFAKNRKLIELIASKGQNSIIHFRMALMKAGDFLLAKQLLEEQKKVNQNQPQPTTTKVAVNVPVTTEPLVINLDENSETNTTGNLQKGMINIGDNYFVVANTYNGKQSIHIRQYDSTDEGKLYPTKKGVVFPLPRWCFFENMESDISDCLNSHSELESEQVWHLGGGVYAKINPEYPIVNIRHYWKPDDAEEPVPTRRGVMLNKFRLDNLRKAMEKIKDFVPEIMNTEPCLYGDDHMNQLGMLRCPECTPFGY